MSMARFDAPPGRPLWLTTLADLALLLVGFFVFLQATQRLDGPAIAAGIRAGFDAAPVAPMPVDFGMVGGFAPGSAALPADTAQAVAFVASAARDPRVAVTLAGATDGDVDAATGSAAILATDRARAVAALLVIRGGAPADRIGFAAPRTGQRGVHIDLGYAGDRQAIAARQAPVAADPNGVSR